MATAATEAPGTRERLVTSAADEPTLDRLRGYNIVMGVAHLVQAILVLILSNDFTLPIFTSETVGAPGQADPVFQKWFDLPIGPAVAVFFLISAFDHLLLASSVAYPWYRRNLQRGINYARWWEYAFSASVMIVLIGLITGITDYRALAGMFALTFVMNLCGLMQELHSIDRRRAGLKTNWTAFVVGCIAGAVPWVLIVMTVLNGDVGNVPNFVWAIIVSLFLFFNCFAINMWLQYAQIGPWQNYLFGETVYMWLSLIAKGALAWQIFSATLID